MIEKRNGKTLVPRGRLPLAHWILDQATEAGVTVTLAPGPDGKPDIAFQTKGASEEQRETMTELIMVCIAFPGAAASAVKIVRERGTSQEETTA